MPAASPRSVPQAKYRLGVTLGATVDPRIFFVPEIFRHEGVGKITVDVFHNGRRLLQTSLPWAGAGDYVAEESTPGSGFDQIRLVAFTPRSAASLSANYFAK